MRKEEEKYEKTIELLRKMRPVLDSTVDIEREVVRRLSTSYGTTEQESFSLSGLLFGWTNIVWIRRSLVTASILLIALFVYQQSVIVDQLNRLSSQVIINQERPLFSTPSDFSRQLKLMKISKNPIQLPDGRFTEKQIDILIESIDRLHEDYNSLMRIIIEDPELKEMIEKRLEDKKKGKLNL